MLKTLKVLQFFRIVDDNSQLSLTNLALIIVLIKLYLAPVIGVGEMVPMFLALLNYSGKKIINIKSPDEASQ